MSRGLIVIGLFVITLLAIAVLVIVALSWSSWKGGKSSNCGKGCGFAECAKTASVFSTTDGPTTGSVVVIPVLGTGGADEEDTGFLSVLSTAICTSKCENRIAATVSAVTDLIVALETEVPTGAALSLGVARIEARVLIDGVAANPGTIVFDQTSRLTEAGVLPGLGDVLENNHAHSFTFLASGICQGCHTVDVQMRAITTALFVGLGGIAALAAVGPRTLLVLPSKDATCCPPSSSSSSSPCCQPCCPSSSSSSCCGCR